MGMVERVSWAPSLGIEYHLGVDGLGALMLVLSAIVTLMSVDAAHRVHHQPNLYFGLVLVLESGLFGSFTALNFFHWFLFWELSLIPAFFLIKLWGGTRRGPAATQFFVYTMAGSVALLLSFLAIFLSTGTHGLRPTHRNSPPPAQLEQMVTAHLGPVMIWLAIGVLAGFAVKVPMIPFHTWLPAAYAEAPSPVTMLLTGAMSKMGVYGLLRIALPLFGHQIAQMRTPLLVLAVATVVMGAWAAAAQKDLKRVFAYSSVNHLGYCLLGIFALAVPASGAAALASQAAALNGVILQMFNHGITAAALFWFVAMIQSAPAAIAASTSSAACASPLPSSPASWASCSSRRSACPASTASSASSSSSAASFRWPGLPPLFPSSACWSPRPSSSPSFRKCSPAPCPNTASAFPTCITASDWPWPPSSASCSSSALCPN